MLLASLQNGAGSTESLVGFIGFVVIAGGIAIALMVAAFRPGSDTDTDAEPAE
ncbi:MAG TPA: hypothetical protein VF035_09175 [Longimicrobiales bacterium]